MSTVESPLKLTVAERIAKIRAAAVSNLGYARLGVASWEQDWLYDWERLKRPLSSPELERLCEIEKQVFGINR